MRHGATIFPRIFHFPIWLMIVRVKSIDPSQCIAPLGMENGIIKDRDITASSSFDHGNVGPHHGRVRSELNGGAWCPQTQATSETKEWLEIDLHSVHMITASEIQGRFGNGQGVEFAEAYVLEYYRHRLNKWIRYQTRTNGAQLKGNINTYLEEKTILDPPIWASKIRFLPYSSYKRTVCMRVELYGCRWSDGIVSYSMPQGDKRGTSWEFYDFSYDGHWDGENLKYGLGQLVDSRYAPDDFKSSHHHANSQNWIGWRNDTRNNTPIEIVFEFDKVREFSVVQIHTNNQFTREVQVFGKARVFFSVGGLKYNSEPIGFDYIEDRIFETSRKVSIKLHHRVGRFVKLQLHFAARWILVSEISFESFPIPGNYSVEEGIKEEKVEIVSINRDEIVSSVIEKNSVIDAMNSPSPTTFGQYLGIIVGILVVIVVLMLAIVLYIMVQQRRYKSSPSQIPDKAALYRTPSCGRITTTSDYTDIRDPEYAIPLQPSLPPLHRPPPLPISQNIFPKVPIFPPPSPSLSSIQYYAATEICDSKFTPPSPCSSSLCSPKFSRPPAPPAWTPPAVRLQRQPRYVTDRMYVEP